MRILHLLALAGLVTAGAATAQPQRPAVRSVSIPFAANGGLRDWQLDKADPASLFVRDRTNRWYHVKLSGPCPRYRSLDTMVYTTNPTGNFDTFSRVSFPGSGNIRCGVQFIERSAPPPQVKSRRR